MGDSLGFGEDCGLEHVVLCKLRIPELHPEKDDGQREFTNRIRRLYIYDVEQRGQQEVDPTQPLPYGAAGRDVAEAGDRRLDRSGGVEKTHRQVKQQPCGRASARPEGYLDVSLLVWQNGVSVQS